MASVIFEIFGCRLKDDSPEARKSRESAKCPFMGLECDGGGNRYLSQINLTSAQFTELRRLYPDRITLPAGVCSLQLSQNASPWIVCPRRLLVLGKQNPQDRTHQKDLEEAVLRKLGYATGTRLGVWSEVKLKYKETVGQINRTFDYTFDYLIMPVGRVSEAAIEVATGRSWREIKSVLENGGYKITRNTFESFVEDCPYGIPSIMEVMTSSTSGGNKVKRSTIPSAFEDALLQRQHTAPGINYRQVWARMASQLLVKSEIGLSWGGKTIWVVQDVLVDYICQNTALNIRQFRAESTQEVNLLSFGYSQSYPDQQGVLELEKPELFAGPITSTPAGSIPPASFQDILRAPVKPSLSRLILTLIRHKPANFLTAP